MPTTDNTPVEYTIFLMVTSSLLLFIIPSLIVLRMYSAQIYDAVIIHMTATWYHDVLLKISHIILKQRNDATTKAVKDQIKPYRLLDIGIGTASALIQKKEAVIAMGIQVVGVDYNGEYVKAAQISLKKNNLDNQVQVHCCSIYEAQVVDKIVKEEGKFDAAYFSGSFSLMPNPVEALHVAASYVKKGGFIYISQTFQKRNVPCLSCIKPLMKHITTIDFGQLYFEKQLEEDLKQSKYEIIENKKIPDSVDNAFQAARSVVLKVA